MCGLLEILNDTLGVLPFAQAVVGQFLRFRKWTELSAWNDRPVIMSEIRLIEGVHVVTIVVLLGDRSYQLMTWREIRPPAGPRKW